MKIMSKGTICIPTLAIMRITFVLPLVPASDAIPTGKVIFDAVVIKIFGKKKSFQEAIKSTTPRDAIAGLLNGKMILNKILNAPAPSIFADSSSSLGIDLKNCRNRNIPRGVIIAGRNRAAWLSIKPTFLNATKLGMTVSCGGTINPASKIMNKTSRPKNSNLANA